MHHKTLAELSKDLQEKRCSSVEMTKHFIARIKSEDKKINSFIAVTEEHALAQAKAADKRLAEGTATPLTGLPIAQKDIFCTEGIKTTCGSKMLDNFVAPYDASIIERFKQAGMVMLGKTNMDEFAMGSSGENSYYKPTANPWDLERVPGGSSSGSAAAVAASLTPASTGTDTGGSIRQPAALCGITGLKPTYGRVSRFGMIAFASSLDCGGLFTKTAEDTALLLKTMAGFDSRDSTSANEPVPDYTKTLSNKLEGLTFGLPKELLENDCDPAIRKNLEDTQKIFEKLGVKFVEISLPHINLSGPAYYIIAPAEASSNLARFDGVRYGYRCTDPKDLEDLYKRSRSEGFGEEVKRRIMIGTHALSSGYYDAYYNKARKIRRLILNDYKDAYEKVDCILSPTTPSTAFKLAEKTSDPISMYLSDIFTISANLAGLPAISIPSGFDSGLPIGVQLTANHFSEAQLLNAAHQFQCETDYHQQIPTEFK